MQRIKPNLCVALHLAVAAAYLKYASLRETRAPWAFFAAIYNVIGV
jgi:hypothetical protein